MSTVATQVLSAVFTPFAGTGPNTPLANSGMWTLLGYARREFGDASTAVDGSSATQRLTPQSVTASPAAAAPAGPAAPEFSSTSSATPTIVIGSLKIYLNKAPTASPQITKVDAVTGVVTGTLNAKDPNKDPLTYSVASGPAKGTLSVSTTGTFTYTPTTAARDTASVAPGFDYDQFAIKISDGRGGATIVTAKNVPVTPTNRPPVASNPPSVGTPDPLTGKVTGNLNVSDPDGNTLTYTVTTPPTKGTVTIAANGTYTYTPTQAARIQAGLSTQSPTATTTLAAAAPNPASDTFVVTAGDGVNSTPVSVTVPISPAQFSVSSTRFNSGLNADAYDIGLSPDGRRAYVIDYRAGKVFVVDTATGAAIGAPISVGQGPRSIALSPDGSRAYVANYISANVSVINTATGAAIGAPIFVGGGAVGIVVSPDGTRAYVANSTANAINVINTATNTLVGPPIRVGTDPNAVALSPDGTRLYVANAGSNTVSVINTTTRVVVGAPIPVGEHPSALAVSPDGKTVYVANQNGNTVSAISTATNAVVNNPIPADSAADVAFSPDGSLAYVVDENRGTVTVIDTRTNTPLAAPLAVGFDPRSIVVSRDGVHAYVGAGDHTISTITLTPITNRAPTAAPTVTNPDFVSGAVTVTLNATDPDGDALTYSVDSGPARGTLLPTGAGTFTYTPNDTARTQAEGTPGPDTDAFTVSVTDGRGATTPVPVTVTVAPALIVNHALTLPGAYQSSIVSPDKGRETVSTVDVDPVTGANTVRVFVFDIASATQIGQTVVIPGGDRHYGEPFVTPDGGRAVYTTSAPTAAGAGRATQYTVVDTTTGRQVGSTVTVAGEAGRIQTVTADGSRVVVTTGTQTGTPSSIVAIIDTTTGRQIGSSVVVGGTVAQDGNSGIGGRVGVMRLGLAMTPDGQRVIVTTNDDTEYSATTPMTSRLIVVDATTGAQIGTTITLRGSAGAVLTPDGTRAVVTAQGYYNQNGTVLNDASQFAVVDTATGAQLGHTVDVDGIASAQLTDDGTRVVSVSSKYSNPGVRVAIYDAATGEQVGATFTNDSIGLNGATDIHGNRVVNYVDPGLGGPLSVSVIDTTTGTQIGTTTQTLGSTYLYGIRQVDAQNHLLDVRYTFNNATTAGQTYVTMIDLATGNPITQTVIDGQLDDSKVSANRAIIATKSAQPGNPSAITRVAVFDADSGAQVGATILTSGAQVYSGAITLTPDGKRAYVLSGSTATSTSSVALIDLSSGAQVGSTATIPGTDLYRNTRVFSPDGSRIIFATDDNGTQVVSVFDTATGALVGAPIRVAGDFYSNATFRADGKRVVVSVPSINATGDDVITNDSVIDTGIGTLVGQPITFPGSDTNSGDAIAPGSNMIEFGAFGPTGNGTAVALIDTNTGAQLGNTVTFTGFPLYPQYRTGDAFGTLLGIDAESVPNTTIVNITHVQTGPAGAPLRISALSPFDDV